MKPKAVVTGQWWRYNSLFLLEHFFGRKFGGRFLGRRRNRLNQAILRSLEGFPRPEPQPVAEAPANLVWGDLRELRSRLHAPLVFRGAAADWPCTKKWGLDFFESEYGDYEVVLNDLVGTIDPNNPQTFRTISMREYIGMMRSGTLQYLKFSNLVQKERKLQEDMDLNWLYRFNKPMATGKTFYMFAGGPGTVTPLHNEFPNVVYVQVSGRKRWVLYLPEDRIFFDPRTDRRIYYYSEADPFKEDPERFPLLKYARRYEVILEPGDILWFPAFAWHYVENLSVSIGVAYKYAHLGSAWRSSGMLTSLFFLATRPNPIIAFIASRLKKDDYTLSKSEKSYS